MSNETIRHALQKVMDICKDGAEGYTVAARCVRNDDLKDVFLHLARQRREFIEKLHTEAERAGYNLHTPGTVTGFFHRLWLTARAVLGSNTDERVVEESIMGEKAAIAVYNEVLRYADVPIHLSNLLEEQQYFIKSAVNRLFELDRDMVYV